jgi:branched-chain amino acid transport system permease protein
MGATVHLATEILIFSIFALGYNILLGYTGAVSFGHAAFFGIAGYVVGFSQIYLLGSQWLSIPIGVIAAIIFSYLVGSLIIRKHGIYFALLTMAFGQMFYFLVYRFTDITGGENGLSGINAPIFNIPGILRIDFNKELNFYFFALILLIIAMLIIWRILHSPFGKTIQGIKENERRIEFLGYNAKKYRLLSFVLSGTFAGLAGSLYAIHLRFAFPQTLHWTMSGEVLIMTLIGGMNNFFGPMLGAFIFLMLRDMISAFTERWMIIVGSIFIFFVMASPEGLLGLFKGKIRFKSLFSFMAKKNSHIR